MIMPLMICTVFRKSWHNFKYIECLLLRVSLNFSVLIFYLKSSVLLYITLYFTVLWNSWFHIGQLLHSNISRYFILVILLHADQKEVSFLIIYAISIYFPLPLYSMWQFKRHFWICIMGGAKISCQARVTNRNRLQNSFCSQTVC